MSSRASRPVTSRARRAARSGASPRPRSINSCTPEGPLTMHFALPRRLLLAALCLTCVVGVALAQDPNVIAAQTAARQWLAFVDRGDVQTSWGAAGKKLHS